MATNVRSTRAIGNNGARDTGHVAPRGRDRRGLAGPQLSPRGDVVGGVDELRRARPRATARLGLPVRRRRTARRRTSSPSSRWGSGTARCPASPPAPATASGRTVPGSRDAGCGSTPPSCCSTPTRARCSGQVTVDTAIFGHAQDAPDERDDTDSAPYVPRGVVVQRRLRLGRRRADAAPLPRHRDLRDARQGHDRAARPRARGSCAGRTPDSRIPAVIDYLAGPGRDRGRAAAGAPVHDRAGGGRSAGLVNYWGYNSLAFFAPHSGYGADRRPRPGK